MSNHSIIKNTNITINVTDMDLSVKFYQSLGFEVKQQWGNHYAQLEARGITIGLHPSDKSNLSGHSGNVSIGFTATNFEEASKLLKDLNINAQERKEEGGEFLHFSDPDGTALYFIKPNW